VLLLRRVCHSSPKVLRDAVGPGWDHHPQGSAIEIEAALGSRRQVGCSASTLHRHVPGGRTAVAKRAISAAK
jgi:hypothetical protein